MTSDPTPDTGPRWTVDEGDWLTYRSTDGRLNADVSVYEASRSVVTAETAYAALVRCVRDADRLAKARELAARTRDVNPWIAHQGGLLDDLLDLLTEARYA